MAVVSVTTMTAKPDRYHDASRTFERSRGSSRSSALATVRLLATREAVEGTGSLAVSR